jgi:hypothetical protein
VRARQAEADHLAVHRCHQPLPEERERGLLQHKLGLKRARYNRVKAKKTANKLAKKQREEAGETVSPDSSDLPSFLRFERSSLDSSEDSVTGGPSGVVLESDSSDGGDDDVPPGAGTTRPDEDLDPGEPIDPAEAASSASDPSDPKGKHVREEGPASEEEPSEKRARLVEPVPDPTAIAPAGGGGDSPSRGGFVCDL